MANSKTSVTEGSGKNVATYSFSEDATTKEVQRIVLNTNAGVEISPATEAKQDDLIAIDYATEDTLGNIEDRIGSTSSSLPAADDTATVGLNGRLIRVAANLTTGNTHLAAIETAVERAITGSVSDTAAPTSTAGTILGARVGRLVAFVTNKGDRPVYIGAATVTTGAYRLDVGETFSWYSEELMQGITTSGTGDVHYVDFY